MLQRVRAPIFQGIWLMIWVGTLLDCPIWADSVGVPNPTDRASVARGAALARVYCVTCHLFPEPDAVDRKTWFDQILPRMKYRLGFSTPELERSPNIQILRQHRRIPESPVISEAQWLDLSAYYLAGAPESPLPQTNPPAIRVGVPGFQVIPLPVTSARPAVTAVKVLPNGGALMADEFSKTVQFIQPNGRPGETWSVSNCVSSFRIFSSGILVGGLGSFLPSDDLRGSAFWIRRNPEPRVEAPILSGLPRTSDANAADLNGDGRLDLVISCFGNNVGRLSWWESRADGSFQEHELFPLPGTLKTEVGDFNGDGRLDIAALVAQETEGLFLFFGDGKGHFERKTVFQRPPYWGHSHFVTADFNRDGRPDFLVANGDNGEFSSPSKRCHGIRLYTSKPDGTWSESWFFPLFGAYQVLARDWDKDGDLDVAAISFFPDYQKVPRGSFVFLQNQGEQRFEAFTFAESATGRWLALDSGDFDKDGKEDLILGSYIHGPTPVPRVLMDIWEKSGPPLILLRNQGL